MPYEVTVEITISDSESIPYILLMGADKCGFYGFILLAGLKGKLVVLFWESTPRNV